MDDTEGKQRRFSPVIAITVTPWMLESMNLYAKKYGLTRSGLIRHAVAEWFGNHRLPESRALMVNGQPFDPKKPFQDYFKQGPNTEYIQTLNEYIEAEQKYYRGR